MTPKHSLFARYVWLEQGWSENVRLHWNEQGDIVQIEQNASAHPHEIIEQWVVPGMVNCHSHAFQRAMAGMTEFAGTTPDSFWSWRELMYRFALALSPEQIHAIAAQLYSECLRHGYTAVCEFHYLHRAPNGEFYQDMTETAQHVLSAAQLTGIGMTMLPVLYSYADFNQQPLRHEQRRFATNPEQVLRMVDMLERWRKVQAGQVEVGVAPHSLRAASTEQIAALMQTLPPDRPIHIHIAEQQKEVDSCIAFSGKRPMQLLFDQVNVDHRWCLVHATHLSKSEITQIADSRAVVGICPSTEGNLGDGLFTLPDYLAQQGHFGIGSDSHVSQSPVEEIRWLEYGQRLRTQQRNIACDTQQVRVGDFLWQASLLGGAQASGRRVGKLAVGMRADALVLDANHPNLNGIDSAYVFNSWLFSGNDNLVRDVLVGGKWQVKDSRHVQQDKIQQRFQQTMQQLRSLN